MPLLEYLGRRCTGSRVRFCTDSPKITIKMKLKSVKEDINIPASGSAGVDVYYGMGKDSVYGGYIAGKREIRMSTSLMADNFLGRLEERSVR